MVKFVLIDHSLTGVEGHHYEYDFNILQAAAAAGFEPVIATHRTFRRTPDMPADWEVHPLFPYTSYSKYTVFSGLGERSLDFRKPLFKPLSERPVKWRRVSALLDWRNFLADQKYASRRERRVRCFGSACRKLFAAVPIEAGDVLFVPTATEFDFECLVNYLESTAASRRVAWHIQFHFNYLEGREPTYAAQAARFDAMRAHFERLLARVEQHQLFLYTTSQLLAEQYGLMGLAEFQVLPYPVSIHLKPEPRVSSSSRLRVTSAGCIRPEKGHQHLNGLVQSLWSDYFATGRLQLVLQSDQANPLAMIPWASYARSRTADAAIEFVRFPLPRPEYLELIRHTHIGLFAYDSDRYYTRCSGVLVEMLSAGIPVIVPAGCWLAEQIAESIYQHQETIGRELPVVSRHPLHDLRWQRADGTPVQPLHTLHVGGAGAGMMAEATADRHANELMVTLETASWPLGTYVRMICEQLDAQGRTQDRSVVVVGRRIQSHRAWTPMLLHLIPGTSRVRLTFENAFYEHIVPLHGLQVSLLNSAARGGCPLGSVGLIAADPGEFAALVREMVDHYPHYAATAAQFAAHWNRKHDPSQTIVQLRERAHGQRQQRRAAA